MVVLYTVSNTARQVTIIIRHMTSRSLIMIASASQVTRILLLSRHDVNVHLYLYTGRHHGSIIMIQLFSRPYQTIVFTLHTVPPKCRLASEEELVLQLLKSKSILHSFYFMVQGLGVV